MWIHPQIYYRLVQQMNHDIQQDKSMKNNDPLRHQPHCHHVPRHHDKQSTSPFINHFKDRNTNALIRFKNNKKHAAYSIPNISTSRNPMCIVVRCSTVMDELSCPKHFSLETRNPQFWIERISSLILKSHLFSSLIQFGLL